jgi:hypothetical protein
MRAGWLLVWFGLTLVSGRADDPTPDLLAESEVEAGYAVQPAPGQPTASTSSPPVRIRFEFNVFNREEFAGLELETGRLPSATWRLNGRPVLPPARGLVYRRIPGIDAALLQDGLNVLEGLGEPYLASHGRETIEGILDAALHDRLGISLRGLRAGDLAFRRGPVLSDLTPTSILVSCQLNLRAPAMLQIADQEIPSKPSLFHTFRAAGLEPDQTYPYTIIGTLTNSDTTARLGPFSFTTPPEQGPIRLAILGFSGAGPNPVARLASAILATQPHAAVVAGPLVPDSRQDDDWDIRFLRPAAALWRNVPIRILPTPGERVSPLLPLLVPGHAMSRNWSQRLGPVQVVGLDSTLDWKPGAIHSKWLERTLEASRAPFLFVVARPPHDSTAPNAEAASSVTNTPAAWDNFLLPLLARRQVTALLLPDLRIYERREVEGAPCLAGNLPQGPAAPALVPEAETPPRPQAGDHFILIEAAEDGCILRAIGPDGHAFDSRSWNPRTP